MQNNPIVILKYSLNGFHFLHVYFYIRDKNYIQRFFLYAKIKDGFLKVF